MIYSRRRADARRRGWTAIDTHYRRDGGDPLGIGRDLDGVSANEAYDATIDTDYPDGVVQIVHLASIAAVGRDHSLGGARLGFSRALRADSARELARRAASRAHARAAAGQSAGRRTPRRTVDVMPSALAALGKTDSAGAGRRIVS